MLLSFLLTAILYCTIPVCIASFQKGEITRGTYRLYCVLSAILVFVILVFMYVGLEIDGSPNLTATVLWSVVAYNWGLSILNKKGKLVRPKKGEQEEPMKNEAKQAKDTSKKFVCSACGASSSGWYQKCPNCGAIGKMRINNGE